MEGDTFVTPCGNCASTAKGRLTKVGKDSFAEDPPKKVVVVTSEMLPAGRVTRSEHAALDCKGKGYPKLGRYADGPYSWRADVARTQP